MQRLRDSKKIKYIYERDTSTSLQKLIKNSSFTSNTMRLNRVPKNFCSELLQCNKKKRISRCDDESVSDKENSKPRGFCFVSSSNSNSQLLFPMIKKKRINNFLKKKICFLQERDCSYRSTVNKNDNTLDLCNNKTKMISSINDQESKENITISPSIPLTCKSTNRSSLQAFLNLNENNHHQILSNPKSTKKKVFLKKVYLSTPFNPIKTKDTNQNQLIESLDHSNDEKDKQMQMQMKNSKSNNYNNLNQHIEADTVFPETKSNIILRICKGKSQPGKSQGQQSKINQDSYLIMTNINNIIDYNMFCVFDGHGLNGHLVSEFVKHYFKNTIESHEDIKELTTLDKIYLKLKENNYNLIKQLFNAAEEQLSLKDFDVNFSGTTCVVIFQLGSKVICANVGDSRAILISHEPCNNHNNNNNGCYNSNQHTKTTPLSFDHKPQLINEKKRILKYGGKVEKFSEYGVKSGPFRVWIKNELYPGLAMSRSIGDLVARSIGVISEPEIIETELNEYSNYIILASDGLWEFIDNNQVTNISKEFYNKNDPEGQCDKLITKATEAWKKSDVVIDDITVVTALFN